jgi:hypothetical protein
MSRAQLLCAEALIAVEGVDQVLVGAQLGPSPVERLDVHFGVLKILGLDPQGIGLDAGVDVLADEAHVVALLLQHDGRAQDAVVGLVRIQGRGQGAVHRQLHPQAPAVGHLDALAQVPVLAQLVQVPRHGAGVAPALVHELLQVVQLLDHHQGDDHQVGLEQEERIGVVDQHIGVQHEALVRHGAPYGWTDDRWADDRWAEDLGSVFCPSVICPSMHRLRVGS